MSNHELIWKEVTVLTLIVLFAMPFYITVERLEVYIGLIFVGIALYTFSKWEEKQAGKSKKMHDYFHHTSSYFLIAVISTIISYFLARMENGLVYLMLGIGIIMFATGIMKLIFSNLEAKA